MTGFVQRELDRIDQLLPSLDPDRSEYQQLMLIKETLCWALDPNMFQSVVDIVINQSTFWSAVSKNKG
jgi:hypothetical protein